MPTSRSTDGLSSSRGNSEPAMNQRVYLFTAKSKERRKEGKKWMDGRGTVLGKARRRRWRRTRRPAESDTGGVADGKRLGETVEGEEKKPVAAAAGAARIAMAPSLSRPVSRSLFSHSFSSPVIRKAQGGEANRERPSAVDVSVDGDRVIRDVDPTFLRSACHASASSPRAF